MKHLQTFENFTTPGPSYKDAQVAEASDMMFKLYDEDFSVDEIVDKLQEIGDFCNVSHVPVPNNEEEKLAILRHIESDPDLNGEYDDVYNWSFEQFCSHLQNLFLKYEAPKLRTAIDAGIL